ncbi:MAG: oxidoreductase, partial [Chloroflexi bacterium]|nr:oxidoreductase [Chloroflexota bacterium]
PIQGGGRIIGEGCHFIDFIAFLVGSPPVSVSVHALPDMEKYNRDNITMTLTFNDGSLGVVNYLANGDKSFSKEYIEVFCEGKIAILEDFRRLTTVENGNRKVIRSVFRQDKGHRGEWEAFINAVKTNGQPPIPYDHLIDVTQTSFQVMEGLMEKT